MLPPDAAPPADLVPPGPPAPPGPAYPGTAPYGTPWPAAPVARRTPRFWGWLIAGVAAGLALTCVVVGGAVVLTVPLLAELLDGCGTAVAGRAPSPRPGDAMSVRQDWAKERIDAALAGQRRALLAGDERCYLAAVAPEADKARAELRDQYQSLRAMQVTAWSDRGYRPSLGDGGDWAVRLTSTPCFGTPTCPESRTASLSRWRVDDDRAVLVDWKLDGRDLLAPWQTDLLTASSGARTVVATVPEHAAELPMLLRAAELAAPVADRYAVGDVPARYVVYYAGESQWQRWFGGNLPNWTAGFAIPLTRDRYEIVIRSELVDETSLPTVLRHELAHAASMAGGSGNGYYQWWLVEGLAEVAAMEGYPPAAYAGLDLVARLQPDLEGDVEVRPPDDNTESWVVGARYGVAYLAVWRLVERFGFERTMAFYRRVVSDSVEAELAAEPTLGVAWAAVERDCAEFIRRIATG